MANKKRLIDANKTMNSIVDLLELEWGYDGIREDVQQIFENAETVDAVEVVRCRDCKHWVKFESSLIGEVKCCTGQGSVNIQKEPDDFCSYGERKDGYGNE